MATVAGDRVPRAERLTLEADPLRVYEEFERRGWTDGLPVVPPSEARVAAMLAAMPGAGTGDGSPEPLRVLGRMPPSNAPVTLEAVAVNAVMAGCRPEYMSVLVAAVEAALDPAFNLRAIQATTSPVTPLILVNGPVAARLGIACGAGCMGPGFRANATIGRALRLLLLNVGGAQPGTADRATHGQPAKFAFCFAEDEAASPFPPFPAARGFDPGTSVVTVTGAAGFLNIADVASRTADELLPVIAQSINSAGTNNAHQGGESLLVLGPDHAAILAAGGLDRPALQRYLFEHARVPARFFAPQYRDHINAGYGTSVGEDGVFPVADRAEDLLIAVAGGPGSHSVYVQNFGRTTRSVSRAVD